MSSANLNKFTIIAILNSNGIYQSEILSFLLLIEKKTRIDKGNFDFNFNLIFAWHVFDSMADTGTETEDDILYTGYKQVRGHDDAA